MMPDGSADVQGIAAAQLRSIVERVERVEGEIADLNRDKSEIYQEAKGNGYSVKTLKKIVALRRRDPAEAAEEDAMLDLYKQALGMA